MAELKFLGYLAEVAGGRNQEIDLGEPKRLREILPQSFPEQDIIILVDGKAGTLDSLIENQNSVVLMPMISGG